MGVKIIEIYNDEGKMILRQILPAKRESWRSEIIVGCSLALALFVWFTRLM